MIRFLDAAGLAARPALAAQMHAHRAAQFHARLGWDVSVDGGEERDQYDGGRALYAVLTDGVRHLGSMRFLPTRGRTMTEEHFDFLYPGAPIRDAAIWECTRFAIAPGAPTGGAAALLLGGLELGLSLGLSGSIGVYGPSMERVYARLGWPPIRLGAEAELRLGLWRYHPRLRRPLERRAGLSSRAVRQGLRIDGIAGGRVPAPL